MPRLPAIAHRIAALYRGWRLEPWDLRPLGDMPASYRVAILLVPLVALAAGIAGLQATGTSLAVGDWWAAAAAVVATVVISQMAFRYDEHSDMDNGAFIASALLLAGRPTEAATCIAVSRLVSAARRPVVRHLLVANLLNGTGTVFAAAAVHAAIAGGAPAFSALWLVSAVAALSIWLLMDLSHDVTFLLGGYLQSLREVGQSFKALAIHTYGALIPMSVLAGGALSFPSRWNLLALLVPQLITYGLFRRTEELTETTIQNRFLQDTFSSYVPASVVERLLEEETAIDLGGEQRHVTVMFVDIRGFTTWAEQHSATYIVERLNELLRMLSDCVFTTEGTLDKFTGDGLMAFWGAPLEQPDHAARAASAALAMAAALEEYNAARPPVERFRLGIGLHTGPAVVGNVGHESRHDYTAIGDTVNLAARIEGATKLFDATVLVSADCHSALPGTLAARFSSLGEVDVKGRTQGVEVLGVVAAGAAEALRPTGS